MENIEDITNKQEQEMLPLETQSVIRRRSSQKANKRGKARIHKGHKEKKKKTLRPYPASSFEEALILPQEILKNASNGKIRRLTLLKVTGKSPTSSGTRMLITNSGKYSLTKGGYTAEWFEVTPAGILACSVETSPVDQLKARFQLAIEGIPPFKALYEEYRGKKLSTHEVMKDFLNSIHPDIENPGECVDLFVVNAKFLGLLQTIAGSETLIPIEHLLEELPKVSTESALSTFHIGSSSVSDSSVQPEKSQWNNVCFYISPIGNEGSEQRQHSDLFLNHLVEPALREFGMKVVRADLISESGMITSQILEYILKSRLVIADLSFQNPNVFYELALRHASKLPIVQLIRKCDNIPFDVDQVRTIPVDNSGIYALVPKLETYRSEIATHVRQALANSDNVTNPLTIFCPGFQISFPK